MSELQQYYDHFRTGYWARENATECPCGGSGWALSDVDTWHQCPAHYAGQPHPDDDFDPGTQTELEITSREAAALANLVRQAFLCYAYPDDHDAEMDRLYGGAPATFDADDDIPF